MSRRSQSLGRGLGGLHIRMENPRTASGPQVYTPFGGGGARVPDVRPEVWESRAVWGEGRSFLGHWFAALTPTRLRADRAAAASAKYPTDSGAHCF